MPADARKLFELYLEDHLAAAVAGTQLAKRMATAERDTPLGAPLQSLCEDIERDLQTLREVVGALDVRARAPVKTAAAWIAEKLARLKLNRRLLRRSPLSLVLELEALQGAVMSKRAVWQTLAALQPHEPGVQSIMFDELQHRADDQHHRIRDLHQRAIRNAFEPGTERGAATSPPPGEAHLRGV